MSTKEKFHPDVGEGSVEDPDSWLFFDPLTGSGPEDSVKNKQRKSQKIRSVNNPPNLDKNA